MIDFDDLNLKFFEFGYFDIHEQLQFLAQWS